MDNAIKKINFDNQEFLSTQEDSNIKNVMHFEKIIKNTSKEYTINVFACEFEKTNNINYVKALEGLVDYLAVKYQSENESVIEIYNYYLFVFCEDIKFSDVYTIEKDTYSMRKIVVRDKIENAEDVIEQRLFKFNVITESVTAEIPLSEDEKKYMDGIKDYKRDTDIKKLFNMCMGM